MSLLAQTTSPYWLAAGWTMFHFLWIGAIVGIFAALVRAVLKGYSPNLRYAVALWCLATLGLIPLALFAHLAGLIPGQQSSLASSAIAPPPTVNSAVANDISPTIQIHGIGTAPSRTTSTPLSPNHTESHLTERATRLLSFCIEYFPWVWILGSPLTLALLVTGVTGIERLRRQCDLLSDDDLPASFQRLAQGIGIARKITVGVTERVAAPMLLGVLRPLILLPPAILGEWSPEQVEMVLLHELAHIRRHDNLVNFLQRIVESLLFFHPVVWKVSRWVRLEREHCCDAVVLQHTGRPQFYAETLASLALPGITPRHAMASLANHQLVDRIRHIMNLEDRSMKVSYRLTGLVAALVVSTGAAMVTWAQQTPPADANGTATNRSAVPREAQKDIGVSNVLQVIGELESNGSVALIGAPDQQYVVEHFQPEGNGLVRGIIAVNVDLSADKKPWSAEQAIGAPDTANAGDFATSWAARAADSPDECLTVTYQEPVDAVAILIYETFNPGAISQIRFYDSSNKQLQVHNFNPAPIPSVPKRVLVLPIPGISDKVARVEMQVNSAAVPGWNEIDAVGLVDASGKTHWASGAQASSSFAEVVARVDQAPQDYAFPNVYTNIKPTPANNQGRTVREYSVHRDRALLEKLQAEVQLMKQQHQMRQTELQQQIERIDREIEKVFEARENASKKNDEMSKRFGPGHPSRVKLEAAKQKYSEEYEDLLRKKGYLRSTGEAAKIWPTGAKPEPDRVERLEEEVRGLRKVLEELQQQLKQRHGATDPTTSGAILPSGGNTTVGQFIESGVISLDPYGNPGGLVSPASAANSTATPDLPQSVPTGAAAEPNAAGPQNGASSKPEGVATPPAGGPMTSVGKPDGISAPAKNEFSRYYSGRLGFNF